MESVKPTGEKEKKRIALVIPKYGLLGGAESVAFEMGERLAQRDAFEVHVLANRWKTGSAAIRFHHIPVVKFPRLFQPISFAHFADLWIRRHPGVLVHSHERIHGMDFMTFHGIPHRTWIREVRKKTMGPFDRATVRVEHGGIVNARLKRIMPVSNLVKEELQRCYEIPESRIRVLNPGIALERFEGRDRMACRREVRSRHGLALTDTVILFMGMNFEIKRLELVIKGMARALEDQPDTSWKLLVAGKGDQSRYGAMARDLGIRDRVVFSGPVTPAEPYFLASDLFVLPSWMDTFGLAVLEAMAAGLPVVITRKVGARDLVENGRNGFVLSDDPEPGELGEALKRLSNPRLRETMGQKAQNKAATRSWEKVVDQLVRIYNRLG